MKKKTSLSIEDTVLEKLKIAGSAETRSVSFLVEATLEGVFAECDLGAEDWAEAVSRYSRKLKNEPKTRKRAVTKMPEGDKAKYPRRHPGQGPGKAKEQ